MVKNCENCMRQEYCEGIVQDGEKCGEHQSINQKLNRLHITFGEWDVFTEEWEKATKAVRDKFGYGKKRPYEGRRANV